jgi:hypothetical protein
MEKPNTPNRGKQPRCKCGLIATFPEHDYENKKLHVVIEGLMDKRSSLEGNLRVAMASNKILHHDIEKLQEEVEQLKKEAYPSRGLDPEDPL